MKLLALETSTDACSAALLIDGDIREKFELAPREHTKLILPMIDSLMADAQLKPQQLDAVVLSRGPGSFTGVRIATGVAHGIAFGADLPVVLVSTLAAIAQDFFNRHDVGISFTAMDARMDEIFWGVYRRNGLGLAELLGGEAVTPAAAAVFPDVSGFGVGSGWGVHGEVLTARLGRRVEDIVSEVWPRAACIAQLGAYDFANGLAVPVEQAMPVYLRDKVAKKQSER
ncbi:tRNA (adenosine(37)-N6)-threonylcarbamoyltransferase complex dimerization subunit type 1 TsaB [Methylomonas sp. LL1]|uniref:tRNA (adenosine(37)-N6)-threonylcarbamoyltransferase complex dimerization subunit type 1 TsaB n=1 Tax=Methylomonas sp. LL1 TaxID=2785785 RepID=UPI0018C3CE92|nr:tRNA (adenosine(37)-N6)-threonylcarbamoyltransferase complex dimerization subunit type 1 TsaB [Methylomonas sp. LL1]QPK64203.1 tRNA (adenosine(37)-N6)-threonylcarbamoyltransferase complex dimerization subunit type 1 TsaB [Methylomonas sp. LL1]